LRSEINVENISYNKNKIHWLHVLELFNTNIITIPDDTFAKNIIKTDDGMNIELYEKTLDCKEYGMFYCLCSMFKK